MPTRRAIVLELPLWKLILFLVPFSYYGTKLLNVWDNIYVTARYLPIDFVVVNPMYGKQDPMNSTLHF